MQQSCLDDGYGAIVDESGCECGCGAGLGAVGAVLVDGDFGGGGGGHVGGVGAMQCNAMREEFDVAR